jgi:ABC-2 type transport system ATP-binding protein
MSSTLPALHIRNLKKTYSNGFEALKGINLDIPEGSFYALLGPNGAGKSTTIGIITGVINATSGEISVLGTRTSEDSVRCKSFIGVVAQEFNFSIFDTVLDIVLTQAGYYGISRSEALPIAERRLKELLLWDKRNEPSRNLSGGMKRRLMIARALIHEPRVLILDEPTAGVDLELRRGMWDFLRELNASGVTIVLTTHYLEEAEALCDRLAIIDHGVIVREGNMRELLSESVDTSYIIESTTGEEEVIIPTNTTIGAIVSARVASGVVVTGVRSKMNRLEALFLELTSKKTGSQGPKTSSVNTKSKKPASSKKLSK